MAKKYHFFSLDQVALIIIGGGASAFYYYFEKMMKASQDLTIFITV